MPNLTTIRDASHPRCGCWPLPHQVDLNPVVLGPAMKHPSAFAVDIGYERLFRRKPFVPVFSVQAGVVTHVEKTDEGHAITVDHGGWVTHYSDVEHALHVNPSRSRHVHAGDVLGYVRAPGFLRFELWQRDADGDLTPINPEPVLERCLVAPDLERQPETDAQAA